MAAMVLRVTPQKLAKLIYDLSGNAIWPAYMGICNADEGTFYVKLSRSQIRKLNKVIPVASISERYDYIHEENRQ